MRLSKFLEPYLDGNEQRIRDGGKPITIGTFINQNLRGRAKHYSKQYADALKRACYLVDAVEVPSHGDGIAYVRKAKLEVYMHVHTCQQCDKPVGGECDCEKGNTTNVWCSARCKEAFDL